MISGSLTAPDLAEKLAQYLKDGAFDEGQNGVEPP
jgi:hypothetical protein